MHDYLGGPGITRLFHYLKSKNIAVTLEEVRAALSSCNVCAECKPQFMKPPKMNLVKATQPFERLSIDFKGPLPSVSANKYILTVTDEYSRFPFAIPCKDVKGIGRGSKVKFWIFCGVNICNSPDFLVFRMGSFVSQLCTVAEIWRDEVGPYAHFFAKMYGKIGLKIENFHINGRKSENLPVIVLHIYQGKQMDTDKTEMWEEWLKTKILNDLYFGGNHEITHITILKFLGITNSNYNVYNHISYVCVVTQGFRTHPDEDESTYEPLLG